MEYSYLKGRKGFIRICVEEQSHESRCPVCTSCHWHQGISSWDDYEVADWLENYWIVLRKQYVLSLRCLRNSKRDLCGWMFRSDTWCLGKKLNLLGVDLVSSFLDQHSNRQNGDKRNLKPTANMWYSGLSPARDQYRTPCPKLLCISQRRRGRILFRPTLSVWCPSKRKVKHFGVERSTWFNIYKNHWSHCITGLVSCTPVYPRSQLDVSHSPKPTGSTCPVVATNLCAWAFFSNAARNETFGRRKHAVKQMVLLHAETWCFKKWCDVT